MGLKPSPRNQASQQNSAGTAANFEQQMSKVGIDCALSWDALQECMERPDGGKADFYCMMPTPPSEEPSAVVSQPGSIMRDPPTARRGDVAAPQFEPSSSGLDEAQRKRNRNMEAARRYRQRKADRVAELEQALAAVNMELELTRLKLSSSEAEVRVLRKIVGTQP